MPADTQPNQAPSHKLWAELTTRITTQNLHPRSGQEETALKSIVDLFKLTRELIGSASGAGGFCDLATRMLNDTIRPYTARWHGWTVDDKFTCDRRRRDFRRELAELRNKLNEDYVPGFRALAFGEPTAAEPAAAAAPQAQAAPLTAWPDLGGPIASGIGTQISIPDEIIRDINKNEHDEIRKRREKLTGVTEATIKDTIGLALSGGGIRSATFSLGIVQVLAQRKLLREVDYISTVSGGGYLGSFLSCYLDDEVAGVTEQPATEREKIDAKIAETFEPTTSGREAAPMRHLRNNSKYLINGGFIGRARMLGLVIFGILVNFIILLPGIALAAVAVWYLKDLWAPEVWHVTAGQPHDWWNGGGHIGTALKYSAIALGGALILMPFFQRYAWQNKPGSDAWKVSSFVEGIALCAALLTALAGILALLPAAFRGYAWLFYQKSAADAQVHWKEILTLAGISLAPMSLARWLAENAAKLPRLSKYLMPVLALSGAIFYIAMFLFFGHHLGLGADPSQPNWDPCYLAIIAGSLLVWALVALDVNTYAPHRPYRNRLCECYLARWKRTESPTPPLQTPAQTPAQAPIHFKEQALMAKVAYGTDDTTLAAKSSAANNNAVGTLEALPLSKLSHTHTAPYHLICACVNLPASKEKNLRGRSADFYIFSKHWCGSPVTGYNGTTKLEELDAHLDLGTAMAISAAAGSSLMGLKLRPLRFFLALLNIRLGYWMPNPPLITNSFMGPGPWYLLREMFGWAHERCRYVNVSDGGHIENLALYELLRRRCKFIIAADGACDPGRTMEELHLLQRYAATDLGARVEYEFNELIPDSTGINRAHAILGRIHYYKKAGLASSSCEQPAVAGGDVPETGWLIFFKLGITGAEPTYVADYRRQHPDFPHQSTADQLFDEAQFEAYRALGQAAAEGMLRDEWFERLDEQCPKCDHGAGRKLTIRRWFSALAANLLPDNDPALARPQAKPGA